MKNPNNNIWYPALVLSCMLLVAGCEKDAVSNAESNEPVELQIAPTVALTRGVIQGGEQSGSGATFMKNVAVYATGDDYAAGNNYAVYTNKTSSWGNDGSDHIYLTHKPATIYGYYPTTNKYNAGAIQVTLLTGTDATTITATDNASTTDIAAASEEVDYMWATEVQDVTNSSNSINLTMSHALSMLSFRVYKESYSGTGRLTKIVVKDINTSGTTLATGTDLNMSITTGTITGTLTDATFTRVISNYTLGTSKTANKVSMLVLPINETVGTNKIQAIFTVDGADYTVNLTAPTDNEGKWLAGKNNLYTVKLSGTELSVTTVSVASWADNAVEGDLTIN